MTNVDKYVAKFATKVGESVTGRSRYYQVGEKILRVSDHIGRNSDGFFQIIVKDNGYIIYHPGTGMINICSYRQVQEFIRTIVLFPVDDRNCQQLVLPTNNNDTILGVPVSAFTEGQINNIKLMVNKVKKINDYA